MKNFEGKRIRDYYNENKLFCNCVILAILFFINCFSYEFTIVSYIALGVMVALDNMQDGFSTLVFSIPFCCIAELTSGALFAICIVIYVIKAYIITFKYEKKRMNKKLLLFMGIFTLYMLLPLDDYRAEFIPKFVIIIGMFLVFNLLTLNLKKFRIKFNLNILALSLLLSAIYFLTYFISPYMQEIREFFYMGEFVRFEAMLINPNSLAMLCEICLAILMYFILTKKFTWVDSIAFVIFAMMGLSTFSKTFLILLGIMLIVLLVFLLKSYPFGGICGLFIASLCIMGIVVLKGDVVITYLERFLNLDSSATSDFDSIMNSITTSRYDLWIGYIDYLLQNPLVLIFGRGISAKHLMGMSAHNIYISMLYQFGIVGIFLLAYVVKLMIRQFKENNLYRPSIPIIVPLVVIGLLGCVEDLFMFIYD